jgi:hypothetical protein
MASALLSQFLHTVISKLTGAKKNRMSERAIAESGHEKIRKTVREKAGTWVLGYLKQREKERPAKCGVKSIVG